MTRTLSIILIATAVGVCVLGAIFLGAGYAGGNLTVAGAALGFGLLFLLLVVPLGGVGVYTLARSRQEAAEGAQADALRKILDMVQSRGQVNISDLVIELGSDTQTVKDMIYRLVGMGIFKGYINWDKGVLYSVEASALRELNQCKNCGGQISLAGKGVIQCPFCGTEYFV